MRPILSKGLPFSIFQISELFESAKLRMNIDFKVNLRVNNEDGYVCTSHRNLFFASIVLSRDAQNAILQEKALGEVIIANELVRLQNTRPWKPVIILAFFHAYATSILLPELYFRELVDFYDLGTALIVTGLPYLLTSY